MELQEVCAVMCWEINGFFKRRVGKAKAGGSYVAQEGISPTPPMQFPLNLPHLFLMQVVMPMV